jgi:general secretion pathway protein D
LNRPQAVAPSAAPAAPPASSPVPPASAPAPPPAPQSGPAVLFNVPSVAVPVGSTTTVTMQVQNIDDLFSAPVRVRFDPKVMQIEEIQQGGMMSGGGSQRTIFTRNIQNDVGEASVILNRLPGSGGANGSGALLIFVVKGVAPGTAKLVPDAPLRNSQMQPIGSAKVSDLTVTVK